MIALAKENEKWRSRGKKWKKGNEKGRKLHWKKRVKNLKALILHPFWVINTKNTNLDNNPVGLNGHAGLPRLDRSLQPNQILLFFHFSNWIRYTYIVYNTYIKYILILFKFLKDQLRLGIHPKIYLWFRILHYYGT